MSTGALSLLSSATGKGSGAAASALLTDSANALTGVLSTALTDKIFNSAQIASQNAIERALAKKDAESAANEKSNAQKQQTEDKIDFSKKYKELLENANGARVRSAQRKVDSINKEIKRINEHQGIAKQDKLRQRGELKLDLINAELRLLSIESDTKTPREQANKINSLANTLKVAIDEYTRGTGPTNEEYVLGQYSPITASDEQFAREAEGMIKEFRSLIRRENISSSRIEMVERTKVQKSLNNANLKIAEAKGLYGDLEALLNNKRSASVNITV